MMRILLFLSLILNPNILVAETVVIRSGEHLDFTRIVVQFSSSVNWTFGRVEGGYELRSDAHDTEFDIGNVFNFIPKTRIQALSSPGPGRLFVSVSCACGGDAFEIRDGRVVLDIKEGQPDDESPFEKNLPTLAFGMTWPQNGSELASNDNPLAWPFTIASVFPTENKFVADGTNPSYETNSIPTTANLFEIETLGVDLMEAPNAEVELSPAFAVPIQITAEQQDFFRDMPNSEDAKNVTVSNAQVQRNENSTLLPTWPPNISDVTAEDSLGLLPDRLAMAKQDLLQQFGRAAAQGVFRIEFPETPFLTQNETSETGVSNVQLPKETAEYIDGSTINPEHLRVETIFDRDRNIPEQMPEFTNSGKACLGQELFEISEWGPQSISDAPYGDLRTHIVMEFDEPDLDAIVGLTRRYLFLGFGAEAKSLLQAFDVAIPDAEILMQIAEIVDNGSAKRPERLLSQLNCSTDAAMWAVLATQKIPDGELKDLKSVLRTFSGLPQHLRERLGPWLAERFLERNDLQTATYIREITNRAIGERDQRFYLMGARIAFVENDNESAMRLFGDVALSGGAAAAEAIVELIENRLDLGLRIDESTAALADSLAIEHRDTELGRNIIRAAIRGLAGSGQIEATFERIEIAYRNGQINSDEMDDLSTEAHLRNAQGASNVDFIKVVFLQGESVGNGSDNAQDTLRKIAIRLIKLGMPAKAIQLYSSTNYNFENTDRQILAEAYLARGDHVRANKQLMGLEGDPPPLLLARISEMQNDFPVAAQIFKALELNDEYESSIWRAGDWQAVELGGIEARVRVAKIILAVDPVLASSQAGTPNPDVSISESRIESNPTSTNDEPDPISESKNLLAQSAATRSIIGDLLNSR